MAYSSKTFHWHCISGTVLGAEDSGVHKQTNYRNGEQISSCQVLRKGWHQKGSEYDYKRATCDPCEDRNVYLDWLWYCITVLQDVTTGGNWVKDTGDSSIISYNCMLIYNCLQKIFIFL